MCGPQCIASKPTSFPKDILSSPFQTDTQFNQVSCFNRSGSLGTKFLHWGFDALRVQVGFGGSFGLIEAGDSASKKLSDHMGCNTWSMLGSTMPWWV